MEYRKGIKKKYLLQCHLIFVTKYRRNILGKIRETLFSTIRNIEKSSDFSINEFEIDKNHIHFLIEYPPTLSISSIVRKLKQETSYNSWRYEEKFLSSIYYRERTLWSDSYFVASVGNANEETIRSYIQNQG